MTDYLLWAAVHLGTLALMLLCAGGVGNLVLRKCPFDNPAEKAVFVLATGLGTCALGLFMLGLAGLLYRQAIWALTITGATMTLSRLAWMRWYAPAIEQREDRVNAREARRVGRLEIAATASLTVLVLVYWMLLLVTSQYPPIHWDSISHHLVLAREFLARHRPVVVPGIQQPLLPALNHMLFTWALALNDDVLAQMVEHTFLMLTAIGLYAWGERQNRRTLGLAAATLWLAHPLVRLLAEAAYVDIALTCYAFLGIYALRLFWDHRRTSWWYLGMGLLAMCAGVKLPGLFFVGLGGLLGLWVLLKRPSTSSAFDGDSRVAPRRFTEMPLVRGWALALLILLPWYGFIAYHAGNPFWPAFAQYSRGIWGAPWVVQGSDELLKSGLRQASIEKFVLLSIDWIRYPDRFNAELNQTLFPLITIWPLAWIVAFFNRSVRWWSLVAFAYTVFWFLEAPLLRYWLPALPMAGLALCESIQQIFETLRPLRRVANMAWVAASIVMLLWGGRGVYAEVRAKGLPPTTPDAREAFLSQLNGYLGVKYVNAHAATDETICVLSASWLTYYFRPRVIDLRGSLFQHRKPTFRWPNDELWAEWLEYQQVTWIFVYYTAPELRIPKQNPVLNPFWPDYQLVYADHTAWVFRRTRPFPLGISDRPTP